MDLFDVIQSSPDPLGAGPNPVQSISQTRNLTQYSPVVAHLHNKEFRTMKMALHEVVPVM